MEQRTDEWFAERAGCISASRITPILSAPSTEGYQNIIHELADERVQYIRPTEEEEYKNADMERGILLEGNAFKDYAVHKFPVPVLKVGFIRHKTIDYVGVSPDGLVGEDGLVEIKVPSALKSGRLKHIRHMTKAFYCGIYKNQVQMQLWVTERDWCDVVSYRPEYPLLPLAIKRVGRDEKLIKKIETACIKANEDIDRAVKAIRNALDEGVAG